MKVRAIIILLIAATGYLACSKNDMSKIPTIALMSFVPDIMKVNFDTCVIKFSLADGDGDIGNDTTSEIYLRDSRYDTAGFVKIPFPAIDPTIEDPQKGLQGTCTFSPVLQPTPRLDSFHMALGDTLTYEFYIKDRAGHQSNHITTHPLIIRP